jgi:hypothetical protein
MKLGELLREAAVDGSAAECGPDVERRLRFEIRRTHRSARWTQGLLAAAASVALLWALLRTPAPAPAPYVREIATPLYAIDASALHGVPDGYVMRVRVPLRTMTSFGLPVNHEVLDQRVDADLIVGSDGSARHPVCSVCPVMQTGI